MFNDTPPVRAVLAGLVSEPKERALPIVTIDWEGLTLVCEVNYEPGHPGGNWEPPTAAECWVERAWIGSRDGAEFPLWVLNESAESALYAAAEEALEAE